MQWEFREHDQAEMKKVGQHASAIRDVAWCNNIGLLDDMVASASDDMTLKIWKKSGDHNKGKAGEWQEA